MVEVQVTMLSAVCGCCGLQAHMHMRMSDELALDVIAI